jgi:hypothetical protein
MRQPADLDSACELGLLELLAVVPLLWLGVVAGAYALVALYPLTAPGAGAPPGLEILDRWALPLLALSVAAGIITCLAGRRRARSGQESGSRRTRDGRNTP